MEEKYIIETLSSTEGLEILRRNGMRISPDVFRRGIQQGVFSFADYIKGAGTKDTYIIYTRPLDEWMKAHGYKKEEKHD